MRGKSRVLILQPNKCQNWVLILKLLKYLYFHEKKVVLVGLKTMTSAPLWKN